MSNTAKKWDVFISHGSEDKDAFVHPAVPLERGTPLPSTSTSGMKMSGKKRGSEDLSAYFPTPRHPVEYIMETFPIVKRKDEEEHNEYRAKRVILKCYDAMQRAKETGGP